MTLTELKFTGEGKSQFMFSQFELEFLQAIAVPEAQIETLSLGRAAVGRRRGAPERTTPLPPADPSHPPVCGPSTEQ